MYKRQAEEIAKPLAQIDKITIIGGEGRDGGVSQMASNVPAVMAKLFESMKETTGIDLGEIMRAGSYDAKVNRNIHVTGLENAIPGPEKKEKSEKKEEREEKAEQPDTE